MFRPGSPAHSFPKMLLGVGEKHYYFIIPQIGPHEKQLRILLDLQTLTALQKSSQFICRKTLTGILQAGGLFA